MTNWFSDHPSTSVITYTLVVVGATWATSTFILQDNRLNLAKSEVESQKSLAEQYKSKSELLQKDIEALRAENLEYRAWLAQSKDAIPIMVPQLVDLKKQLARLNAQSPATPDTVNTSPPQAAGSAAIAPPPTPTTVDKPKALPNSFAQPRTAKLGSAGVDDTTGLIVTVKQTSTDRTATLLLKLPDRSQIIEEHVYAGQQFKFAWGGRTFVLTILEISFLSDTVTYRIQAADA
jgi:hypothetical protein